MADSEDDQGGSPSPSIDVIYDITLKRFDFITKSYEAVNNRAAAIFAFSSFVITGSSSALKEMYIQGFDMKFLVTSFLILITAFCLLARACYVAYDINNMWILPGAEKVNTKLGHLNPPFTKHHLMTTIDKFINEPYTSEVDRKFKSLKRAIWFLIIEIILVFGASALPYLPHRRLGMSSKTEAAARANPPATQEQPSVTAAIKAAPIAPSPAPHMQIKPLLGPEDLRQICLEDDRRGVQTLEANYDSPVTFERTRRDGGTK